MIGLLIGLLHTPPVRARLGNWALSSLSTDAYRITARRIEYNLLALDLRLSGLEIMVPETQQRSFFRADELHANLAWSSLWRGPVIQVLELRRPEVDADIEADGRSNLPRLAGDTEFGRILIEHLAIEDFRATWFDASLGAQLRLGGLNVELADTDGTISGPLSLDRPATLRIGEIEGTLDDLAATIGYDGYDLEIQSLVAKTSIGTMHLTGTVRGVLDHADLDLRLESELQLAPITALTQGRTAAQGTLTARGVVRGTADAPEGDLEVEGNEIAWGELGQVAVLGSAALSAGRLRLESLQLDAAGASLHASATVDLENERHPGRAQARLDSFDPGPLLSSIGMDMSVSLATLLSAEIDAEWDALQLRSTSRLTATTPGTISSPVGGPLVPLQGVMEVVTDGLGLEDQR